MHLKAYFQSFPDLLKFFGLSLLQAKLWVCEKKVFNLFLVFTTYNFDCYPLDFKEVVHLGTWSDLDGDFCVGKIVKSSKRGAMTPI